MATFLTYRMLGPDRRIFLPGATSSGHHQIELSCHACHTPWMGVKEKACYGCHAVELQAANDSHPKSKFTDPRNADRLKDISAADCVTCHREHVPEQTRAMGVTMPDDYCSHCHQETLQERPSHKDFAFQSCAIAGCHNYHDNTALYEDFLLKHAQEPKHKQPAVRPARQFFADRTPANRLKELRPLTAERMDAPESILANSALVHDWAATAHARAGVNCSDCHAVEEATARTKRWTNKLDQAACMSCHKEEAAGFFAGKHGMRLAQKLTPMTPALARLPMKREAAHRGLTCVSCHGAHRFDTRQAAVESCLACHNDNHSLAYKGSKHYELWEEEIAGRLSPGRGVNCGTCHLPRETRKNGDPARVFVQHNQNSNLRPNEKMIRSVCLDCHGLGFSLDALADAALVRTNFIGQPVRHIESIELALRRQMQEQKPKTNP